MYKGNLLMRKAFLNLTFCIVYLVLVVFNGYKTEVQASEFSNSSLPILEKWESLNIALIDNDDSSKSNSALNKSQFVDQNLNNNTYLKKRIKTKDFLRAYDQAVITSKYKSFNNIKRKYKPTFILSKNYWKFALFPEQVINNAEKSPDYSKYMDNFNNSYSYKLKTDDQTQIGSLSIVDFILGDYSVDPENVITIGLKSIKYLTGDYLYDYFYGPEKQLSLDEIQKLSPETVKGYNQLAKRRYLATYQPYYQFSWRNLFKYGPTLKEIENAMFIIILFRFLFYSKSYGLKSAFYICAIALMSTYCYMTVLQDAIAYPRNITWRNTTLFRPFFESILTRKKISDTKYLDFASPTIKAKIRTLSPSQRKKVIREYRRTQKSKSKIPIPSFYINDGFELVTDKLKDTVNKVTDNFTRKLIDPTVRSINAQIKPSLLELRQSDAFKIFGRIKSYINYFIASYVISDKVANQFYYAYVFCGRLGKNLLPYHFEWHLNFILIFMHISVPYLQGTYTRLNQFLLNVLIPENRVLEAELTIYYMSLISGAMVYFLMLAMLHAIFSQYFYIPLIVPGVENNTGPRPKTSIYSGGYTSWQDEISFIEPTIGNIKIWFGWLGKGSNNRKQRRKGRRKKDK